VIKEEVMLRCAAGELLQRVSATHRQCEADLRKLLVHMKMKSIADLIDINSPLRSDNLPPAVVLVDIEKVAALSQSEINPERRSRLRQTHQERQLDWQTIIKGWGDAFAQLLALPTSPKGQLETTPRLRRKSMQNLLFSVQLQQLSTSLDGDDQPLRASLSPGATGLSGDHDQDDDFAITRQSVMEYMEHHGSFFKAHQKKMYASQEGDRIRKLIKIEIEDQLSQADCAESHEKVLVPVLHALNGFVCGRLSGQERAAVSAYATGALGDQVRIMRSLLNIFLAFVKDRDSADSPGIRTQVSTDISDASELVDYFQSLSYGDSDSRLILTSLQVLEFLHWAANIGDIIGLQVPPPDPPFPSDLPSSRQSAS
jgi:hypothetical protein